MTATQPKPKPHATLSRTVGQHTYLFRFPFSERQHAEEVMARFASDPELNFQWSDACALGGDLRIIEAMLGEPTPKCETNGCCTFDIDLPPREWSYGRLLGFLGVVGVWVVLMCEWMAWRRGQ